MEGLRQGWIASLIAGLILFALAGWAIGQDANPTAPDGSTAVMELEQAVAATPGDLRLRLRLAEAYVSAGRSDAAIAQYREVIAIADPRSEEGREASRRMRYLVALGHADIGEFDQAIAIFRELVEEYPDNVIILYNTGIVYMLRGELDEAQATLERVIAIDPGYVNAYVNLASVMERKGDVAAAIGLLEQAAEIAPGSPAALRARAELEFLEGRLLLQQGNVQEAVGAFERALEAEPSHRDALLALAAVHRQTDDRTAELEVFRRIARFHPGDLQSRLRMAELQLATGRVEEAWNELEAISASSPPGPIAAQARRLLDRVQATEQGKRLADERARTEIRRLETHLAADPADATAWKELAVLHFRRGDNQAAARAFEAARDIDPDDLHPRYALASIYDSLGRFSDAAREYAAVLRLEQDEAMREQVTATLRAVNAKRLYVENRYGEAITEFEQILAIDPDNELAHFYLGLIYAQEEQTLRAVDAYQEVIRIVPSHLGARLNLASSYERLNREEDAIDEYAKILQANPPPHIAEVVQRAMDNARRRMRGVSVNLGYVMGYDSNTNLSDSDEIEDFRSDLTLNLAWQYKASNDLRWRFLFSPSYATYHRGQYDYLNTTATLSAGWMRGRYNLVGGYTHRTTEGMLTSSRIGRMGTVFAEGFTRIKLPPLLRPWGDERVFSNISATLSYTDFDGESNPFFSAYTSAAGISVSQPVSENAMMRTGYQYVINSNKELVGSDYAYTSHGLSLGLDLRRPWGSMNANYGLTLLDYTNPDSFSQFTSRRRNVRHNLALGATWRFRPDLSLFTTVSWSVNNSNLPVGFVLSSEDIIEGLQSSSLSDYERLGVAVGVTLSF